MLHCSGRLMNQSLFELFSTSLNNEARFPYFQVCFFVFYREREPVFYDICFIWGSITTYNLPSIFSSQSLYLFRKRISKLTRPGIIRFNEHIHVCVKCWDVAWFEAVEINVELSELWSQVKGAKIFYETFIFIGYIFHYIPAAWYDVCKMCPC